ncbi:MAG: hypothetical protein ISR58_08855 [Anaerolineales bacterium]|nr:hypothetical protein [Chloroflexota bacterium]MBL6981287.1 hypothetical protein [Anaerolineales bacterium]
MKLIPNLTPSSNASDLGRGAWKLEIPPGPKGRYRLAQLDDYSSLDRRAFPWKTPLSLSLQARASNPDIPGTWGFGFWNDPFSLSLGFGGGSRRLPALPNAAWFFYASPQNYLSFRDDLPANGLLAATFRSPSWPPTILALGVPGIPFLIWKHTSRLIRRLASRIIQQDATQINIDVSQWHQYRLNWQRNLVCFEIDGEKVLKTQIAPKDPLGLILWIDNQYAALPPTGGLAYGTLHTEKPELLEIKDLQLEMN